jgi:DNA-binding MarR family transcriptional regulator
MRTTVKVRDEYTDRKIVIELTEEEAKKLAGLAVYFPVNSNETRTWDANNFALTLSDLLEERNIESPAREKFIRKY